MDIIFHFASLHNNIEMHNHFLSIQEEKSFSILSMPSKKTFQQVLIKVTENGKNNTFGVLFFDS